LAIQKIPYFSAASAAETKETFLLTILILILESLIKTLFCSGPIKDLGQAHLLQHFSRCF
jgi:hypothetical protein